jgi:hypothetical protein
MTIARTSGGVRTAVVRRADRTVIVTRGAGQGYIQRPFVARNQPFVQRTYYVNHATYVRVYRPYVFHGVILYAYAPVRYYPPAFYMWARSPWRTPIVYHWGWIGSPWYGYYESYFSPYPTYPSAAFWLTDYVLAATLAQTYQDRMAASGEQQSGLSPMLSRFDGEPGLTPEAKEAIAGEVQRQLAQQSNEAQEAGPAAASSDLPPSLAGSGPHVFVVSHSLDVTQAGAGGEECAVTEGDILRLDGPPPHDAVAANVRVLASKGQDCRRGSLVSVAVEDLLEMQNTIRGTLDQGLDELRAQQGQDGVPKLPEKAKAAPVQASFVATAPPADPNVGDELGQQAQLATQTEQEVASQAWGGQPFPAAVESPVRMEPRESAPTTVFLGQTSDEVTASMGTPTKIVDLGTKKLYFYKSLVVVFRDGRVSEVQ